MEIEDGGSAVGAAESQTFLGDVLQLSRFFRRHHGIRHESTTK